MDKGTESSTPLLCSPPGQRRDLQGTHGVSGSSPWLRATSHPGLFPQHTPGSRGSSKSLPDEGAFLGFVKPRAVWEHR